MSSQKITNTKQTKKTIGFTPKETFQLAQITCGASDMVNDLNDDWLAFT